MLNILYSYTFIFFHVILDIFVYILYIINVTNEIACPRLGFVLKEKEEFARQDPDKSQKFYWLAVLNWFVPITLVFIGLIITTQKFAPMMNYDPAVIGHPVFTFKNGYRVYNPLVFIIGMMKYALNETYSEYFFQAIPPAFICLISAIVLFVLTSIFVNAHQKNQHIHGTARFATRKDLKKYGMLQQHGVVCGELAELE